MLAKIKQHPPNRNKELGENIRRVYTAAIEANPRLKQEETRIYIVEEFSDFKPEGKLTLPHTYKLQLEVKGPSGTLLYDWIVNRTQFEFGQMINEKEFNVESN